MAPTGPAAASSEGKGNNSVVIALSVILILLVIVVIAVAVWKVKKSKNEKSARVARPQSAPHFNTAFEPNPFHVPQSAGLTSTSSDLRLDVDNYVQMYSKSNAVCTTTTANAETAV